MKWKFQSHKSEKSPSILFCVTFKDRTYHTNSHCESHGWVGCILLTSQVTINLTKLAWLLVLTVVGWDVVVLWMVCWTPGHWPLVWWDWWRLRLSESINWLTQGLKIVTNHTTGHAPALCPSALCCTARCCVSPGRPHTTRGSCAPWSRPCVVPHQLPTTQYWS